MSEIDPKRKEALIDKHRYTNVDYDDWWDCVYSLFREDMAALGIRVDDMQFSGFCSQGDGASFTGYVVHEDVFLDKHPALKDDRPMMLKLMKEFGGSVNISISRISYQYAHENTVTADVECDHFWDVCDGSDPLRMAVLEKWDEELDGELADLQPAVREIIRDYCRDLYRRLEDEYDHLTSDEVVWETIEANDWHLDEEDEETDEYA